MKYCCHCGKEIMDNAVVCVNCGCAVNGVAELDIPHTGLNILAFCFPIVGLILYCTMQSKTPKKANAIGKSALIGFGVGLVCSFLLML